MTEFVLTTLSKRIPAYAFALTTLLLVTPASAGTILDRVRAEGTVHCGAFPRPGLAIDVGEADAAAADSIGAEPAQTPWHGLTVEICMAVATAVLGSPDKIDFHGYEAPDDFDQLAGGKDDIGFLTAAEMHMTGVTGRVVPGPIVYIESIAAMVPETSGIRHLADLDGTKGVCFGNGSAPEHVLPDYFARRHQDWHPMGYTEDGELLDAYNVHRCGVLAGERTTLAMDALETGVNGLKSLILPEPIAATPILATTGTADAEWSAIVAWTVYTLQSGDRPSTDWRVGGAAAMPVPLADAGLSKDWQTRVLKTFGSYHAIREKTLGGGSPLRLPAGLNARPEDGGALIGPMFE
jgi:general L-amino acid transport system substrate-binding protein